MGALCSVSGTFLFLPVLLELTELGSPLFDSGKLCFWLIVFSCVATAYGAYIAPWKNKRIPGFIITFAIAVLFALTLLGDVSRMYVIVGIISILCSFLTAFCLKPVSDESHLFSQPGSCWWRHYKNPRYYRQFPENQQKAIPENQQKAINKKSSQVYGWYLALGVIVALFTPEDILSSYPFLAEYFVDPIAMLPQSFLDIPKWAAYSRFPEVTRFTFALLVFVFPATVVFYCREIREDQDPRLKSPHKWHYLFLKIIAVYPAMLLMIFFPALWINHYATGFEEVTRSDILFSFMIEFAETSRLGLAFVLPLMLSVLSFFLCFALFFIPKAYLEALVSEKASNKI